MAYTIPEKLKRLEIYEPVTEIYNVRLDANESFQNLPDDIRRDVLKAVEQVEFNRYPDPFAVKLCEKFGRFFHVKPELLTAGNGSDELISLIVPNFLESGDTMLVALPDFSMYTFYAQMNNIRVEAPFGRDDVDGSITLTTRLDDNLYLFMDSPRGYIKSSADLAVKYTAFLSIIILLIGSWLIYLAVDRMTKPIRNIQEVADKISRLDFSQNCPARGSDEIARLATSINNMSDELQSNISRLVEANDILKSDLERQQQTEQMRRQFIANVSHDFKTPLTLMISYAEALSEQAHGEQAQECCEIIIGEGNKLSAMVGRLLELSRLESGVARAEKSIFCLSEVLDESVRSLRILTEPRGIQVRRCLDEEFIVCADYTKIDQVVTNLFENAAKYAPKGAVVTLRAQRAGVDACRVSVENTGAQIPQEDISSLFDSFYRGDKARSNDGQSYGLGLAIVRGIMDAHGRPYGVENIEGGVRFWFELELADLDDTDDSSGDMPEEGI